MDLSTGCVFLGGGCRPRAEVGSLAVNVNNEPLAEIRGVEFQRL